MATRVVHDKEGDGNNCKSNDNEDDGQATAMRAMAMLPWKVMAWVMVMVTRLAGDKEGKGKGSKGNGDGNEGGR